MEKDDTMDIGEWIRAKIEDFVMSSPENTVNMDSAEKTFDVHRQDAKGAGRQRPASLGAMGQGSLLWGDV